MCHAEPIMGGAQENVRPVEQISIGRGSEQLPAFISRPAGNAPSPALLMISDVFGASPFYQQLAGRLAHEGYTVLLPDLFFRIGPLQEQTLDAAILRAARLDTDQTLQDVAVALDYLQHQKGVEPKAVAVTGFCMGGTLTMLIAEHNAEIGGACVFYGFPVNHRDPSRSPIDEVEKIQCPLLGFWGDQDAGVGMENVQRLDRELARLDKNYEIVIYPGAGHGFMARRTPADAAAAEDAWPKMLQFLDRVLRAGPVASS